MARQVGRRHLRPVPGLLGQHLVSTIKGRSMGQIRRPQDGWAPIDPYKASEHLVTIIVLMDTKLGGPLKFPNFPFGLGSLWISVSEGALDAVQLGLPTLLLRCSCCAHCPLAAPVCVWDPGALSKNGVFGPRNSISPLHTCPHISTDVGQRGRCPG